MVSFENGRISGKLFQLLLVISDLSDTGSRDTFHLITYRSKTEAYKDCPKFF